MNVTAACNARPLHRPAAFHSRRVQACKCTASGERKGSCAALPLPVLLSAALSLAGPSGPALADLDQQTYKAGVGAKIEGSDITLQDSQEVVEQLSGVIADAKQKIGEVAENEGGAGIASYAKELDTAQDEAKNLLRTAKDGGNPSNVKSLASSIEQQVNSYKALAGFD